MCMDYIIKDFFQSWTGLASKLVRKYFPKSLATLQVKFNQTRKNERSTQIPISTTIEPGNAERHISYTTVVDEGKFQSDQTGVFNSPSSKGVKYVFILYYYYSNTIFRPPQEQNWKNIFHAYKMCH